MFVADGFVEGPMSETNFTVVDRAPWRTLKDKTLVQRLLYYLRICSFGRMQAGGWVSFPDLCRLLERDEYLITHQQLLRVFARDHRNQRQPQCVNGPRFEVTYQGRRPVRIRATRGWSPEIVEDVVDLPVHIR